MKNILVLFLIFHSTSSFCQRIENTDKFTRADTLRGSITPERAWWDLTYYHLQVKPNAKDSTLQGSTDIHYRVLQSNTTLQIDLQQPLQIDSIVQDGEKLKYKRDGNAYFVSLIKNQIIGKNESVKVFYSGRPVVAKNPPWDGGLQWVKDKNGQDWISTSCQGIGASIWWPCKDHMYDEADSMQISVTIPEHLYDVSNGNLKSIVQNNDGTRTFNWKVENPINNYGVNMNVGNYEYWNEIYQGEKGPLQLSYFALKQDIDKAKNQFKQVPMMLKAFEHWFGPYPFYEDGYKLVQVPYLGMEHQSSVTYGNKFQNGYLGRDLSKTGWGLKWDFIIIHESGHEWFANNITYKDVADMWVHESFTNYSETLYTEYYYGKEAGADYVIGLRDAIANDKPIVGIYGVNQEGSKDMYNKGGNMLHTIRQIVNDDEKWRQILRGLNKDFYHQTVEGSEIENYINQRAGRDISKIFDQYLRDYRIPTLEYEFTGKKVRYRWTEAITGFDMPVKVKIGEHQPQMIYPTTQWKSLKNKGSKSLSTDRNYYVNSRQN